MKFFLACVFGLFAFDALAATVPPDLEDPFAYPGPMGWYTVGGDPCRGNPDCTPERTYGIAAERGLLPEGVAKEAIRRFNAADLMLAKGEDPPWEKMEVCHGDTMFMTFGAKEFRFVDHMVARFSGCTTAHGFTLFDPESRRRFIVFRVDACANLGGREVEPFDDLAAAPSVAAPAPAVMAAITNPSISGLPPFGGTWTTCCGGTNPPPPCKSECEPPPAPISLPASMTGLALGLAVLVLVGRRRKRSI